MGLCNSIYLCIKVAAIGALEGNVNSKNFLPDHANRKTLVVQSCTCTDWLSTLQASAHKLVKPCSNFRRCAPAMALIYLVLKMSKSGKGKTLLQFIWSSTLASMKWLWITTVQLLAKFRDTYFWRHGPWTRDLLILRFFTRSYDHVISYLEMIRSMTKLNF